MQAGSIVPFSISSISELLLGLICPFVLVGSVWKLFL